MNLTLLSPDLRYGRGLGHLVRCLDAARRAEGFVLHIPAPPVTGSRSAGEVAGVAGIDEVPVDGRPAPWSEYRIVVLDRQDGSREDVPTEATTIGIDLGGPAREHVDFLIDSLPGVPERSVPNRTESGLVALPHNRRSSAVKEIRTVLVSFGGEDPADLTRILARALSRGGLSKRWDVTLVRGPANRRQLPEGFAVLSSVKDLKERLWQYDLVITSFGLTAFEALAAGCAVVTLNPSRYHRRLAGIAGIPSVGVRRARTPLLNRLCDDPAKLTAEAVAQRSATSKRLLESRRTDLATVVGTLQVRTPPGSPVSGERGNRVVARFETRTYYRCRRTGLIFLQRFDEQRMEYGHDYFFDGYAAQYGRTYLDDFAHIRGLAASRLRRISTHAKGGALLDVGCAYGPFLHAAEEAEYRAHGLDISAEAVDYVRATLGIPAACGGFLETDRDVLRDSLGRSSFDVLTMWYVIEHFTDLAAVLSKVNRLLPRGGVFAFSTPNALGISGRSSLRQFLDASPVDHYTVWSPASAGAVLERFGFAVDSFRITGHHPERFGTRFARPGSMLNRAAGVASRVFELGDTFEVYARKVREHRDE